MIFFVVVVKVCRGLKCKLIKFGHVHMTLDNLRGMGGGVGVECLPVDTEVHCTVFFILQSSYLFSAPARHDLDVGLLYLSILLNDC